MASSSSSSSSTSPFDKFLAQNRIRYVGHERQSAKPAYIVMLGSFTGDMWHCAVAQILFEYRINGSPFPFPNWWAKTCISIMVPDPKRVLNKKLEKPVPRLEEETLKHGKVSYEFLISLGLPCVLAPVRWVSVTNYELSNRSLEYSEVRNLDDAQSQILASSSIARAFDDTYSTFRPDHPIGMREGKDGGMEPIKDKGPDKEDYLISLHQSTSVVMQLMQYIGVENSQIILRERLCRYLTSTQEQAAMDRFNRLETIIKKVKSGQPTKKILLFNYRLGKVNRQHDSSRSLLEQVKTMAAAKGIAVIIVPQMEEEEYQETFFEVERGANFSAASTRKLYLDDIIFNMFDLCDTTARQEPEYKDKRITVKFWALVAQNLQLPLRDSSSEVIPEQDKARKCIIGLIGGRSGSMDLPSFVGINCMSWDEPFIIPPEQPPDWSRRPSTLELPNMSVCTIPYTTKTLDVQMPQYLRLLNQHPITLVTYLSRYGVRTKEKTQKRTNSSSGGESESGNASNFLTESESDTSTISSSSGKSKKRKVKDSTIDSGAGAGLSSQQEDTLQTKKSRAARESKEGKSPTSNNDSDLPSIGATVTGKRKSSTNKEMTAAPWAGVGVSPQQEAALQTKKSRAGGESKEGKLLTPTEDSDPPSTEETVTVERKRSTNKETAAAPRAGAKSFSDVTPPNKKTKSRSKGKSGSTDNITMQKVTRSVDRDKMPIYHYLDANKIVDSFLGQEPRTLANLLPQCDPDYLFCQMFNYQTKTVGVRNFRSELEKEALGIKAVNLDAVATYLKSLEDTQAASSSSSSSSSSLRFSTSSSSSSGPNAAPKFPDKNRVLRCGPKPSLPQMTASSAVPSAKFQPPDSQFASPRKTMAHTRYDPHSTVTRAQAQDPKEEKIQAASSSSASSSSANPAAGSFTISQHRRIPKKEKVAIPKPGAGSSPVVRYDPTCSSGARGEQTAPLPASLVASRAMRFLPTGNLQAPRAQPSNQIWTVLPATSESASSLAVPHLSDAPGLETIQGQIPAPLPLVDQVIPSSGAGLGKTQHAAYAQAQSISHTPTPTVAVSSSASSTAARVPSYPLGPGGVQTLAPATSHASGFSIPPSRIQSTQTQPVARSLMGRTAPALPAAAATTNATPSQMQVSPPSVPIRRLMTQKPPGSFGSKHA